MYRTIAPDAVERRWKDMQRHRGAYIVPGHDYVWSIDGYLKLEPCGIEIYAGIDAYSWYIIGPYGGQRTVPISHSYSNRSPFSSI